jgi:hypothetical protein
MGVMTKRTSNLIEQVGRANRNVLRLEAAGTAGSGWSRFKEAYKLLDRGHVGVTGPVDHVVVETARGGGQANGAQNSGAAGATLTGKIPEPAPIDLPL